MHRKAQMGAPLSYIFALVIGGIVFLFFIGFAYQFIALSGSVDAAETVQTLNDEFTAFSVSDSAEKVIDYAGEFDFYVLDGKISTGGQSQTMDQILFAPYRVYGEEIYVATKAVELPYRATNIFYIADGHTAYILVYSSADSEEIVEELVGSYNAIPQNFPSEAYDEDQVSANIDTIYDITLSFDTVRFIFFDRPDDTTLDDLEGALGDRLEVLLVSPDSEDYRYGSVEFDDATEVAYMGTPLLIGAFIAADADSYLYALEATLEKLSVVTDVYGDKAQFLSARLPSCDYTNVKAGLTSYERAIGDTDSYSSYQGSSESLEDYNKALGGECPEIF